MNIEDKLRSLLNYFSGTRGIGHTKSIKDATKNTNVVVICASEEEAAEHDNGLSINNMERLHGLRSVAVLDNHTVMVITREALEEIARLKMEIQARDEIAMSIHAASVKYQMLLQTGAK